MVEMETAPLGGGPPAHPLGSGDRPTARCLRLGTATVTDTSLECGFVHARSSVHLRDSA